MRALEEVNAGIRGSQRFWWLISPRWALLFVSPHVDLPLAVSRITTSRPPKSRQSWHRMLVSFYPALRQVQGDLDQWFSAGNLDLFRPLMPYFWKKDGREAR
jgi:hypothetical protein